MPVFEELLSPETDKVISLLLFKLATWHAFAELRLHSDSTLSAFELATTSLGHVMRTFLRKVCSKVTTQELPRETEARQARVAKTAASQAAGPSSQPTQPSKPSARVKKFNLNTYKYHRLGDYVRTIRKFGTTDNFTSQTVRSRKSEWSGS